MESARFYPESTLRDRIKLVCDWIPQPCARLLDGGCAYGAGTRHFQKKVGKVWGIDPNPELLTVARERSPDIEFVQCGLEKTPFDSEYFNAVILNDVLEHVADEPTALNEMYRVLAPEGVLLITTPHAGFFSFLDPDNYAFHLRAKLPGLYRWIYRRKYGQAPPVQVRPGYDQRHRHYTIEDFVRMLDASKFKGHYSFDSVFRGGLLLGVLTSNLHELGSLVFGLEATWRLLTPMRWLADRDYFVRYGRLSYNIGIKVRKLRCSQGGERR